MGNQRIDIGSIRREQIIEAAVNIITEQGLESLSLSEIEKRAGMSRGQLTYYFPAKEDILLAVFDRLLQLMYQRIGAPEGAEACAPGKPPDWVRHLLEKLVGRPPVSPEFHALQYTFLAQIGYRDDFRRRVASLYAEWRGNLARGFAEKMPRAGRERRTSPEALATLVQAMLHGLAMQAAADPKAYDREEMLHLCLDVIGNYVDPPRPSRNGSPS